MFCHIMWSYVLMHSHMRLLVAKCGAGVFAAKPRLPLLVGYDADGTKLCIVEHHHLDGTLVGGGLASPHQ